jgi:hypothetical protein
MAKSSQNSKICQYVGLTLFHESMKATGAWADSTLHRLVRDTFQVSLAVARIRLERLYGEREV